MRDGRAIVLPTVAEREDTDRDYEVCVEQGNAVHVHITFSRAGIGSDWQAYVHSGGP